MKPQLVLNELSIDQLAKQKLPMSEVQNHLANLGLVAAEAARRGFHDGIRFFSDVPDMSCGPAPLRACGSSSEPHRDNIVYLLRRLDRQSYADILLNSPPEDLQCELTVDGQRARGLELAWITGGASVSVNVPPFDTPSVKALATTLEDDVVVEKQVEVRNLSSQPHFAAHARYFDSLSRTGLDSGPELLARWNESFPYLVLCPGASKQLQAMTGNEPGWNHIVSHLIWLNGCAGHFLETGRQDWTPEVDWSPENDTTLNHSQHGPKRRFAVPSGVDPIQFSFHTKIKATNQRIYFGISKQADKDIVLVGYVGNHLSTVKYPT